MERRFVLFLVLSFAVLMAHFAVMSRLNPRPAPKPQPDQAQQAAAGRDDAKRRPPPEQQRPKPPKDQGQHREPAEPAKGPEDKPPKPVQAQPDISRKWVTLGSLDPASPYRMLVTLTNKGAAVARIELSSPRYHDLDDRSGYLGHLVMDETLIDKEIRGKGCLVQVVGPGTPAAAAGLKPGDLIEAVGKQRITSPEGFRRALATTKPNRQIMLTVLRGSKRLTLPVTLRRRPLEVVRPEADDPLSLLLTLQQLDDRELTRDEATNAVEVGKELEGLDLWTSNWEVTAADRSKVVFRRVLAVPGLEITKTYRLAMVPTKAINNANYRAYHLVFDIRIRNVGQQARKVAYQLDGPTGLPDEGAWYAYKVSRSWGAAGLRDVVVSFDHRTPNMVNCPKIAEDKIGPPWQDESLTFIGVDAQYFSAVLIPQKKDPHEIWFAQSQPLRVGKVDQKMLKLTDTSCRVVSRPHELSPGDGLAHQFVVFAGPKRPDLLQKYGLKEIVYYGWFGWLAVPMAHILHVFYALVCNYGLAILMLTVLVRGCMFPLSKKQTLGAQKMQELQPEIKKIQEKYKKDMEARTKAQQELFRKHNYNPLSGCLVLFIQLPIFIALYRSLMVDIELRQAPLVSESVRWCSNLAAPDMLFNWSGFMPEFINSGVGIFGLGPYFNLLPMLTIALFIAQQKMFMPPPTDEQQVMQQKIMKYMMVFMGILFFKVASGLCVYFIASSAWGLAERKFLPKTTHQKPADKPISRAQAKAQARPKPQQTAPSGDGAARKKKQKKSRGRK